MNSEIQMFDLVAPTEDIPTRHFRPIARRDIPHGRELAAA